MNAILSRFAYWCLNLWILGYTVVIGLALLLQFAGHELPCPLCMLQRYAMIISTLGALWIVRQAEHGVLTHDRYMQSIGLGALGAFVGAVFASRQIMLHILPGDAGYGGAVLGLHLYTWAFVTFCVVILFTALLCIVAPGALPQAPAKGSMGDRLSSAISLAFLAVVAINAVMIVCLEGFAWVLPDDPVGYGLFGS